MLIRRVMLTLPLLFGWSSQMRGQDTVAIPGEPFGVCRIHVVWPEPIESDLPVTVTSPDGQVFYPATITHTVRLHEPIQLEPPSRELRFGRGKIIERLAQVVKAAATSEDRLETVGHDIYFLFRGEKPFQVTVAGGSAVTTAVRPAGAAPNVNMIILDEWWEAYQAEAEQRIAAGIYLPVVDSYLLSTLARRLGLQPSAVLSRLRIENVPDAIAMMADSHAIQRRALATTLRGMDVADIAPLADLPPEELAPPIDPLDDDEGPEGVETISRFVPPECFYLRFANFSNFLWFQKLAQEHGGNIQNMFEAPVYDESVSQRIEELLNVRYLELADLMGDQLIRDVAVIGTDLLIGDGPSLGVLLHAKNAFLLSNLMETDRKQTAAKIADCKLETISIDGVEVSLLSTPDNRIRSFWIRNGDWFFVTSSLHLATRMIEARKSRQTLAATAEFHAFRAAYPIGDKHPITVYLPSRFLASLYSPRFQVEAFRRAGAVAEMSLLQAARHCAVGEGYQLSEPDELEAAGFLPVGFGRRADGGRVKIADDKGFDSRRGIRGSMLPIYDTPVEKISPAERLWQEQVTRHKRDHASQIQPLFVQMIRESSHAGDPRLERLRIQVDASPGVLGNHAWVVDELGPATDIGVRHATDDLVSFHAHIASNWLGGTIPPHHLFGGIKDCYPAPLEQFESPLQRIFALSSVRGYLAAWPEPGMVDRLPLGLGRGTPVGPKTTRLVGGAYRYQSNRVSLLSFNRDVLTSTVPQLAVLDQQPPTRASITVKDLRGTKLEQWVNDVLLAREIEKSLSGADLLNRLSTQLRITPAEAPGVAKQLLGADPKCAVGGQYVVDDQRLWSSIPRELDTTPSAPLLKWLGGFHATVNVVDQRIKADADVILRRASTEKAKSPRERKRASL